jgi:hypothetical protein
VAAVDIDQQIIEQITPTWPIPQMVVWIDDRQLGLDDRFFAPIKPSLADWKVICAQRCAGWGRCGH